MLTEIDMDFYCSTDFMQMINDKLEPCQCLCCECPACHRKYPTPEQFKEKMDEEINETFPVWLLIEEDPGENFLDWTLMTYADALQYERESEEADIAPNVYIVCACTPFGKPPQDWRPE